MQTFPKPKFENNTQTPLIKGNFIQRWLFTYLTKMIKSGDKHPYQFEMLYKLDSRFTYDGDYPNFEAHLEKKLQNQASLDQIVKSYYRKYFIPNFILGIFGSIFQIFIPISIKQILL